MAIKFTAPTRHGTNLFVPGVSLAFEDVDAEPYFVAAGFAEKTSDKPMMTYSIGEVDVDPETVFGDGPNKGKLVMGGE